MRMAMRILFFAVTLFIALALILTFRQPAFTTATGAQILFFKTRDYPVYYYVLGAFIAGLLLGFLPMLVKFAGARAAAGRAERKVRELERKLNDTEKPKES